MMEQKSHSQVWAGHSDFLQKSRVCRQKRKIVKLQHRSLTNTMSSYLIKVNINSDKSYL